MGSLNLDTNQISHLNDIQAVLMFGLNEPVRFQSLSRWISQSGEFQNWMSSNKSAGLFLEAQGDFERTTSVSFFATLLHQNLQSVSGALILTFFCGLDTTSHLQEDLSGLTAMARSLFVHLLATEKLDVGHEQHASSALSFLSIDDITSMRTNSFESYLYAVSGLLLGLTQRYSAVFVIIDAIDFYDKLWDTEVLHFIKTMRSQEQVEQAAEKRRDGGGCEVAAKCVKPVPLLPIVRKDSSQTPNP
jgi:hypothetical protein